MHRCILSPFSETLNTKAVGTGESVSDEIRRLMMFRIYQEECGHQIYMRCQVFTAQSAIYSNLTCRLLAYFAKAERI